MNDEWKGLGKKREFPKRSVTLHLEFLGEIGTGQLRNAFPLTPVLRSAECVHLQRSSNVFPLDQPAVVRNVCTYSGTRMRFRYTSPS